MMHGSLYNRLLAAALQPQQQAAAGSGSGTSDTAGGSGGGAGAGSGRFGGLLPSAPQSARPPQPRPVIQHLVWQVRLSPPMQCKGIRSIVSMIDAIFST